MANLRVWTARRWWPEDYVSNRNISNIFEEVPVLDKLEFEKYEVRSGKCEV